jgi:hypothetical protein
MLIALSLQPAVASLAYAGQGEVDETKIVKIEALRRVNPSDVSLFYVYVDKPAQMTPAGSTLKNCQREDLTQPRFSINATDPDAAPLIATILAAESQAKTVTILGMGDCRDQAGVEALRAITVLPH